MMSQFISEIFAHIKAGIVHIATTLRHQPSAVVRHQEGEEK